MDTNEWQQKNLTITDLPPQIHLVLNNPEADGIEVNLMRVFETMKQSRRVYAWLMVLCIVAGFCAPLLLYQITKPNLTVSSVVTLDYDVEDVPVTDLIAPDGTPLDLTQILSSYVLSKALTGLKLSEPITISELRSNIKIERVLTDSSRRIQEIAAQMKEDKNTEAFAQAQNVTLTYQNRFIVSLSNGFRNDELGKNKLLKKSELCVLLNRVISAYNDYLAETYADHKLPVDEFSVINPDRLDVLDCLDQLRSAANNLYTYCSSKPESTLSYRSWKTGHTLSDLMDSLQTCREVDINYLYSYIYLNGITKDKNTLLLSYQYRLRNNRINLDTLNKNMETIDSILKNYKNDEIVVARQENDYSRVSSTSTEYFNQLFLQQAENIKDAADIQIKIDDLSGKITKLTSTDESSLYAADTQEQIKNELNRAINNSLQIFTQIRAHMEELQESSQYNSFMTNTNAAGKEENYLTRNIKKMVIFGVIGGAASVCLWFLSAFLREFKYLNDEKKSKKGAIA